MSAKLLLGCGVLALAIGASAQYPPRDRGYSNAGPGLIGNVLQDLDRAASYSYVDRHERHHFDQARRDLLRFEDNWRRGRFDRDRLDGAIENVQHLVNADQLDPRDRRVLWRDLGALRSFRAQRGYRWSPY